MPFADALSRHPDGAEAVGEVIGQLLEQVGPEPDLAVLFVTEPHLAAFADIADGVRQLLQPRTLLGATAVSVVAGAREVETGHALSVWAGSPGPVDPVRLDAVRTPDGWAFAGMPADVPDGRSLVLLADPFSFPVDAFLDALDRSETTVPVVGGLASAARGPGGNRLVLDEAVVDDGAVAVLLPAGTVTTVVSQGCRPIGQPYVVTASDGLQLRELGGQPALARLQEIVGALDPEERGLVQHGLHIGCVIDEHQLSFGRGDFLVRNVLGVERESGAVVVGQAVEVGSTVQFQVRDAASADEDLRALLSGTDAEGALLFTCNGRGSHLFDEPDHDASLVHAAVDGGGTAGMFCAGEVGPVGGRNFVHGFTASVALFGGH